MVKTSLVEADLLAGWRLLIAIDAGYGDLFRVKAAFWMFYPESEEWRLVIATPLVDEQGPLSTYRNVQHILFEIQPSDLSLQNIAVISPKDALAKAFRTAMRIAPESTYFRSRRTSVAGHYVEDAYVYRIPPPIDF